MPQPEKIIAFDMNGSSYVELIDEYREMLARYCRPGFRGKNVAFASPSMHDPNTETIREVIINGSQAVVKTTNTEREGFKSDYEYSFTLDQGRWFLEGLDYINEEDPGSVL